MLTSGAIVEEDYDFKREVMSSKLVSTIHKYFSVGLAIQTKERNSQGYRGINLSACGLFWSLAWDQEKIVHQRARTIPEC